MNKNTTHSWSEIAYQLADVWVETGTQMWKNWFALVGLVLPFAPTTKTKLVVKEVHPKIDELPRKKASQQVQAINKVTEQQAHLREREEVNKPKQTSIESETTKQDLLQTDDFDGAEVIPSPNFNCQSRHPAGSDTWQQEFPRQDSRISLQQAEEPAQPMVPAEKYEALKQQFEEQAQLVADLQQQVTELRRLATIGESKLNKWRRNTFF